MRQAMAEAVVGDDVLGDDPTVKRLEAIAAEQFGFDAGLFVPSGTMGNQIAVAVHARPGDEVILEADSHVFHFEGGASAAISGVQARPLAGVECVLGPDAIAHAIRGEDDHVPRTSMVVIENTHNMGGGRIVPLDAIRSVSEVCRRADIRLHLDGARIFNAVVATGLDPKSWGDPFDSATFCLSKGLGAPIGSILLGSKDFIRQSRRVRKRLGGGMRQVGVLAAAGLVALEEGPRGLVQDHANAAHLAAELAGMKRVSRVAPTQTNIVRVDLEGEADCAAEVVKACEEAGVWILAIGERSLRLVTHRDVDASDVERALEVLGRVLDEGKSK